MFNPMTVLKEAIKAVPAVKYALGVAGLGAVVAIIAGFNIDFRVAVFGILIIFVLMFGLLVFAKATETPKGPAPGQQFNWRGPAMFLTWSFMIIIVVSVSLFVTSFFFGLPYIKGLSPDKEPQVEDISKQDLHGQDNAEPVVKPEERPKPQPTFSVVGLTDDIAKKIADKTKYRLSKSGEGVKVEVVLPDPTVTSSGRFRYDGGLLQFIVGGITCTTTIQLDPTDNLGESSEASARNLIKQLVNKAIADNNEIAANKIAQCVTQD
jgi:hypothetical protein